jgi:heterodisulfide reductase subunit A-like polyferredoxin
VTHTLERAIEHAHDAVGQRSLRPGDDLRGDVMVVGGGISGIQAALDLATSGFKVYLVEKTPGMSTRTSAPAARSASSTARSRSRIRSTRTCR